MSQGQGHLVKYHLKTSTIDHYYTMIEYVMWSTFRFKLCFQVHVHIMYDTKLT